MLLTAEGEGNSVALLFEQWDYVHPEIQYAGTPKYLRMGQVDR